MRFLKFLGFIFGSFIKISTRADNVKKDPERAKTSIRYGVISIVLGVIAILTALPFANLFVKVFVLGTTNNYYIIGNIFVIAFSFAFLVIPICFALNSLSYGITQMFINRKVISYIALILSIIVLILSVINIFYIFGNIFVGNGVKVIYPLW